MEPLRREDVDVKRHIVNEDLQGAQRMVELVEREGEDAADEKLKRRRTRQLH